MDRPKVLGDSPVAAGHLCCEHAKEWFNDAQQAWGVIAELERRGLVISNAVRGTQRYINGQKHHGRSVNTAAVTSTPPQPTSSGDSPK